MIHSEPGRVIRTLIVDDEALVRDGFAALLSTQPDIAVVGTASDGQQAVEQVHQLRIQAREPDVILMDIRMPRLDGMAATRLILDAESTDRPRILVLTTFDLDDYVYEALRSGASGFLLKHATSSELLAAVRVVAAGEALLAPTVTTRLIENYVRTQPTTRWRNRRPDALSELTPREIDVLELVAKGLSNTEIATTLVIAEQTVKTHFGHILTKLRLRDRAQAVIVAYEHGLVVPDI